MNWNIDTYIFAPMNVLKNLIGRRSIYSDCPQVASIKLSKVLWE